MSEDLDWLEGHAPTIPLMGLDKRQLSAATGYPLKRIDKLCREGMPARSSGSKRGGLRFDLPVVIEWIAAQRAAEAGGDGETLADAKRRLTVATAKRRELEAAKMQEELFPFELMGRIVRDRYVKLRTRMQCIDMEVGGLTAIQRDDLLAAIDDALNEVAQAKFAADLELDLAKFEEPSEV